MIKKPCVYFLRGIKNNFIYIGSTTNLHFRFNKHQKGLVKSTKAWLPIKLEFYQEYKTIREARQIEYRLKRLKRKDYYEAIIKDRKIKMK